VTDLIRNQILNEFKYFQTLTDPKRTFLSSKNLKYVFELFEEGNNFLHRNFSRFISIKKSEKLLGLEFNRFC
jgi:hypothetical protein